MKIVLAASIYPPEIGGPSFYAASLEEALEKEGTEVEVAVLSSYRRIPPGFRHLWYAYALWRKARGAEAVIAFDLHAAGLPAVVAARMRGIPTIVRVGGDFVWEHYSNRTGDMIPLPDFYARESHLSAKERFAFRLVRLLARNAVLAFSSPWIADIWREPYGLTDARVRVIENAIEPKLEPLAPARKNFIFFSRRIPLKNHIAFRRAFERVKQKHTDIELEEGMIPHKELLERMRGCYAVVAPSISEVTPNYILDAIRCGKPFLLTKYSGYAERFKEYGVIVDPLSEESMARGIEQLSDAATYEKLRANIAAFSEVRTYDDIAREFLLLIKDRA